MENTADSQNPGTHFQPDNSGIEPYYEEDSDSLFSRLKGFFKIGLIIVLVLGIIGGGFLAYNLFFGQKKNEHVALTYWGLWEDEKTMKKIISEFEKQNPNISVTYIKQDPKDYRKRVATRIQNGTGPDIYRFHNSWLAMISPDLLPLPQNVITMDELKKNYYPTVSNDVVKNGAIYGIPLEIDTLSLFVNTELFESQGLSIPKTWDEFLNAARSITVVDPETKKIKTAGAAIGTFDNIEHAADIVSLLFVQNGANLNDLLSTQENASEAIDFYTLFAKGENKVWDETLDNSLMAFASGKVGMMFGYSWDAILIKAMNPSLSFAVYPVPHLPGKDETIASYWVEGVSSQTKHPEEAFTFMKFLKSKEAQQSLFTESSKTRLFGEPYSLVSLASSLKDNQFLAAVMDQAPSAVSSYFVSSTYDDGLNTQVNEYLGNAVRSALVSSSSGSSIEALANGVSQVLSQFAPTPGAKK